MHELEEITCLPGQKRITLNAFGVEFKVTEEILHKSKEGSRLHDLKKHKDLTDAELSEICDDFDRDSLEFFFNRDPNVLKLILIYLMNGQLHMDLNMCPVQFASELDYWRIDHGLINRCCVHRFEDEYTEKVEENEKENQLIKKCEEELKKRKTFREWIWNTVHHPKNSNSATVIELI